MAESNSLEQAVETAVRDWVRDATDGGITTSFVVIACALRPDDLSGTTYVHLYPAQQPIHIAAGLALRGLDYLRRGPGENE